MIRSQTCTTRSLSLSSELVASSNISIGGFPCAGRPHERRFLRHDGFRIASSFP